MKLQFLHLSDFHFESDRKQKAAEIFNQDNVNNSMLDAIEKLVNDGESFDFIVITGDIAFSGEEKEYQIAKIFIEKLLKNTNSSKNNLFIVPGNHDINRKQFKKQLCLFESQEDITNILKDSELLPLLTSKLSEFNQFGNECMGRHVFVPDRFYFCDSIVIKKNDLTYTVNLLGLNSAFLGGYDGDDQKKLALGLVQVNSALEKMDEKAILNIACFHHPFEHFHPEDTIVQNILKDKADIILNGHLHEPKPQDIRDPSGKVIRIGAGACFKTRKEHNWFDVVEINLNSGHGKVHFYKYLPDHNRWKKDTDLNPDIKDGHFPFQVKLKPSSKIKKSGTKKIIKKTVVPLFPKEYTRWITENYGYMEADKLYGKGQSFVLKLPEIFIPLYANDPSLKQGRKTQFEDRQSPVDLEKLIAENDTLLIEGHPGSGKTTLLKHLTYILAIDNGQPLPYPSLQDYVPILIYLKDMNDFFKSKKRINSENFKVQDILKWCFKEKMNNILDVSSIDLFIQAGKVLFLIDGLDEIASEYRDKVVQAFADLIIKIPKNKLVLTGRPHGITGTALNRFDDKHVKILSLDSEQINHFIRKWFTYFYPGVSGIGSKTAEAMIGEIQAHQAIDKLKDNPLMLTAICILYHDNKELPGQRAELYKKFIENLLYRRFKEPELVHSYLKTLAFRMHVKRERSIDENAAVEVLKEVYHKEKNENDQEYHQRTVNLFRDCEPKCGLFKFEGGAYTFWHLTFQEFLAADYLVDNHSNHIDAIAPYWEEIVKDEWYKEMIELYVGYLSIANKKTANDIVSTVIEKEDRSPYIRWCTAAQALYDIEKDRREPELVKKTNDRLFEIVKEDTKPTVIAGAGEILGWLGDPRNLKEFIQIMGGEYDLEDIGKRKIKPFEISKYPVTNSWYEEFVNEGGYKNNELWTEEGKKWLEYTKTSYPRFWYDRKWRCPNAPVVGVTWYEAVAFTKWLTKESKGRYQYRLPAEAEWQAAAAGFEKRQYPWGDKWEEGKCNNRDSKIEKTSSVGIFKKGNTPDGICDLAGNVWEWTMSDYHSKKDLDDFQFDKKMQFLIDKEKWDEYWEIMDDTTHQLPVLRGGSWPNDRDFCRCAIRFRLFPFFRSFNVGFCCART